MCHLNGIGTGGNMNRTQEVELTNMCFIYDENRILVEEKKGTKYTNGLVFPGGHIAGRKLQRFCNKRDKRRNRIRYF